MKVDVRRFCFESRERSWGNRFEQLDAIAKRVEHINAVVSIQRFIRDDDHACALIKYRIVVGKGMEIPGEAIGVFHIENGQMVEYWLLERDQKMINDIVRVSGKASLAGGSNAQMALGALKQPLAVARTIRRVIRVKRGNTQKML